MNECAVLIVVAVDIGSVPVGIGVAITGVAVITMVTVVGAIAVTSRSGDVKDWCCGDIEGWCCGDIEGWCCGDIGLVKFAILPDQSYLIAGRDCGLDHWTGLLDWISGLDYWTDL